MPEVFVAEGTAEAVLADVRAFQQGLRDLESARRSDGRRRLALSLTLTLAGLAVAAGLATNGHMGPGLGVLGVVLFVHAGRPMRRLFHWDDNPRTIAEQAGLDVVHSGTPGLSPDEARSERAAEAVAALLDALPDFEGRVSITAEVEAGHGLPEDPPHPDVHRVRRVAVLVSGAHELTLLEETCRWHVMPIDMDTNETRRMGARLGSGTIRWFGSVLTVDDARALASQAGLTSGA